MGILTSMRSSSRTSSKRPGSCGRQTTCAQHTIDRSPGLADDAVETVRTNIPAQLTSFVGREREIAELQQLLEDVRLLTLVGAGGIGKTRLALRLASQLAPSVQDGTFLVELAALQDPTLVPQAVAAILDIRERPDEPLQVTLAEALQNQEVLLVLDNCEHLIAACAELAESLLRACAKLRIVATGRQPLGLAGETTWRVPSLSVPDAQSTDEVAASEAVRLFLDRTHSILPGFTLTDRNAATVALICQHLDGIPLALELAAARVSALGVEQILARLDDRFRLLGGGTARGDPRHRTLRATVEWSHDLLGEGERVLFRRLSVFAGGWTLEAAESVCAGADLPPDDVFDRLARLVHQSLVLVEGQETVARYGLLETLRQYAAEQLESIAEAAPVRDRHLDWYLALAERADAQLTGPAQSTWLDVLEREHDNIRAALRWCLESGSTDRGLTLATACGYFWQIRGHRYRSEGRHWLNEALANTASTSNPAARARALYWAGTFAAEQFDFVSATTLLEECLQLWQALGNRRGLAEALLGLGLVARDAGDFVRAEELLSRSLDLSRQLDDRLKTARALRHLGSVAVLLDDASRALELLGESLALLQALGESHLEGHLHDQLGQAERARGALDSAAAAHHRAMALLERAGCAEGVNTSRYLQARLAQARGERTQALAMAAHSLQGYREVGNRRDVPSCLDLVAELVVDETPRRSVHLFAVSEAMRESMGVVLPPVDRASHSAGVAAAQTALGGAAFDTAWAVGRASPPDEGIGLAIACAEPAAGPGGMVSVSGVQLTPRELEVAGLVGRGHSNKEIAASLVVSLRTAEAHVTNVLNKLGLRSRAQLAVWAAEHGLIKHAE
jgi:predicted ATPase/DNA-binding CsgD family transcriptional regulator